MWEYIIAIGATALITALVSKGYWGWIRSTLEKVYRVLGASGDVLSSVSALLKEIHKASEDHVIDEAELDAIMEKYAIATEDIDDLIEWINEYRKF